MSKYKVALNYLIVGTQVDVLYQVIPRDKVKRVGGHTKTFVILLTDDSTAQDPNNIMPHMKLFVDCNADVLLGCFINYTCYTASKEKGGRTIMNANYALRIRKGLIFQLTSVCWYF